LLAFHPSSQFLVLRRERAPFERWDFSGNEPKQLVGPDSEADAIAGLSVDNRCLFSISRSIGTVRDLATTKQIGAPLTSTPLIESCGVGPQGRRVIVVERSKLLHIGDTATGKWLATPLRCRFPVRVTSFSPNGERLVIAGGGGALIANALTGEMLATLACGDAAIDYSRFSPDGRLLVTGDGSRGARVWDVETGRAVTPLLPHGGAVLDSVFAEQNRTLTIVSRGAICSWRLPVGWASSRDAPVEQGGDHASRSARPEGLHAQDRELSKRSAIVNGRRIEARETQGGIRVFASDTGEPVGPVLDHARPVLHVGFCPDGTLLATADESGDVRVWDSETGELLVPARRPSLPIVDIDGAKVVCAGGKEYTWEVEGSNESPECLQAHARVLACARIDDVRQRQPLDARELRAEWNAYQRQEQKTK
jgi:WD40 repeat protein